MMTTRATMPARREATGVTIAIAMMQRPLRINNNNACNSAMATHSQS